MSSGFKITKELKEQFSQSMKKNLDEFEKMILALEKKPSDEKNINTAFRDVHTIKGESDYMAISDINILSHEMEGLLDLIRKKSLKITPQIVDLLFKCLNAFREMNANVTKEKYIEQNISQLVISIKTISEKEEPEKQDAKPKRNIVDVKSVFYNASVQHISYINQIAKGISEGGSGKGAKVKILRVLKTFYGSANYVKFSNIVSTIKSLQQLINEKSFITKKLSLQIIENLVIIQSQLQQLKKTDSDETNTSNENIEISTETILDKNINIPIDKIDDFMNQVSELGIIMNSFSQLVRNIETKDNDNHWVNEIKTVYQNVSKISDSLNRDIKKLRLVDINILFSPLERIVRDLSRRKNKKIQLSILGSNVQIDRKVVEYLVDPVIHIIRNAVDHGIESPSERINIGKSEEGLIVVKAQRIENQIVIEIIDDGKGINPEQIRRIILERKLIPPSDLTKMNDQEVVGLIFLPGYSTIIKADKTSGRGVGLDIVKSNIKTIGGSVTVNYEPGKATGFKLQVPVEMVTLEVLITEVAGEKYAFPINSIFETINVNSNEINTLNHKKVITFRDEVIAIKNFKEIIGLDNNPSFTDHHTDLPVLLIYTGNRISGIVVDKIIGRTDIIAKPLEKHLASINEFSGASVLGDGSVVLIVDANELF